ncbi:hypothetical protein GCM10007103_16750 [Salinimicrobium marinum]|uniref:NlpE C-terminal OB domain-containing protein n=1 Tax=Salinimicrobium marinum TaxID=680283 RepID=A0A918SCX6_9FLAO|nr:hypothetical protein [Salinimicrobium marinum]GHA35944.1 hypothetical protein GCM10007103_16750 [Salinimicrobium marinum]
MKEKVLALLLCLFLFSACGDSGDDEMESMEPEAVADSIPTLEGQFIFLSNEAILKGESFIYGVAIDSVSLNLAEKVKPFKNESFDMVPVKVKAKILKNSSTRGWNETIEIREVLELPESKPASEKEAFEE